MTTLSLLHFDKGVYYDEMGRATTPIPLDTNLVTTTGLFNNVLTTKAGSTSPASVIDVTIDHLPVNEPDARMFLGELRVCNDTTPFVFDANPNPFPPYYNPANPKELH